MYIIPILVCMYIKYGSYVLLPTLVIISESAPVIFSAMAPYMRIPWDEIQYRVYTCARRSYLTSPYQNAMVMSWYEICDIFPFSMNIHPIIAQDAWECDSILWIMSDISFTGHIYFPKYSWWMGAPFFPFYNYLCK